MLKTLSFCLLFPRVLSLSKPFPISMLENWLRCLASEMLEVLNFLSVFVVDLFYAMLVAKLKEGTFLFMNVCILNYLRGVMWVNISYLTIFFCINCYIFSMEGSSFLYCLDLLLCLACYHYIRSFLNYLFYSASYLFSLLIYFSLVLRCEFSCYNRVISLLKFWTYAMNSL